MNALRRTVGSAGSCINSTGSSSFTISLASTAGSSSIRTSSILRLSRIERHLSTASLRACRATSSNPQRTTRIRTMATSVPSTMKGVLIEKTGGVEVLDYKTDMPVPQPKQGEVLVKNDLIGINYIDTYFRTGLYPAPKPEILGREAEGVIAALGPDTESPHFKLGDKVVWMHTGAYAEYTAVPLTHLFAMPAGMPRGLAAASILQGLTAMTLIDDAYAAQPGDWLLVHAAAGGVGQWLVQTLKARGAHVVATASTPEKRALAARLGADVVVGYGKDEVLDAVRRATAGAGVHAAYDGVGKDTFDLSLEALRRKGTVASFGNASGAPEPLVIARLSAKNAKVCRPTLFNYLVTEEERGKYSKEVFDLVLGKKIEVSVHKTYPLSDIKQAHMDLEGRKTSGKLLLDPSK